MSCEHVPRSIQHERLHLLRIILRFFLVYFIYISRSVHISQVILFFQDVTITNDGATILKLLEVEHPAAKILCELADLQDQEVGDGTTSVVILAAELLKGANELVTQKIHPTSIISGYRLACKLVTTIFVYIFDCIIIV